jgi:hypothetical protein
LWKFKELGSISGRYWTGKTRAVWGFSPREGDLGRGSLMRISFGDVIEHVAPAADQPR